MRQRLRTRSGSARQVVVDAAAKVNLGLAVGPARSDGFHDIATIFQSVSLADTLILEPRRRGFSLRVRFEDVAVQGGSRVATADVPTGAKNIVIRAAQRTAAHLNIETGARITLIKRIPSRSGLGGASADAAAVMVGLAALNEKRPRSRQLLEWGAELGSDVPFALYGGTALGLGRGERLRRLRLERPFEAVVAIPRWGVSTAQAYAKMDHRKNILTLWKARLLSAETLGRKQLRAATTARFGNAFEDVLGVKRRAFDSLRTRLRRAGLTGVRMSGSGSAVFGVLPSSRSAQEVVRRFEGIEALYVVRSTRTSMRVRHLP